MMYLGMPVTVRKLRNKDLEFIDARFIKKLDAWQGNARFIKKHCFPLVLKFAMIRSARLMGGRERF
jgi:hypothetical protein